MDDYRDLFLAEAQEYLQNMTVCLLKLERSPTDSISLAEIFRAAHSLKGMAGTMGYEVITELTHELENMFDHLRNGELAVGTELINLLFKVVDMLQLLISNLDSQDSFRKQSEELQKKLVEWYRPFSENEEQTVGVGSPPFNQNNYFPMEMLNEFEKEILRDATSNGEKSYSARVRLLDGVLLKSVRAHMVLKVIEKVGEIIKTVPSLQALEDENFERDFLLLFCGNADPKKLRKDIMGIAEIETVEVDEVNIADEQKKVLPAEGDRYEEGSKGALLLDADPVPKKQETVIAVIDKEDEPEISKARNGVIAARAVEKTVRVETAKLDTLVNLVGELIINRTHVVEQGKRIGNELLGNSLEQLERITTELQGAVMTLRMVPIRQVFDRFPRMIRDLSLEKGKKLELIITGEETELDRTIVNQIGDPLVHLLRNAVDHGIEDAEERKRKGKDPVGKIFLEARHEGSHVVVSVEDDGAGINVDIIRRKALEKSIIKREELDLLTPEETIHLIFHSGFSTSEKITDVSGRGVGMDVVKTAIEALNGNVEVKSEPEKGTKFILRLPLTLAIIKTLMVKNEKEIFAIPIETIRENLVVERNEIKTIGQDKVITLREEVLPLYCLKEKLKLGSFQEQKAYPVVIVQAADKKAGFIVDELMGQQEIVIKSLSSFIKDVKGVTGATVLGDGKVSLILDVVGLLETGGVNFGKENINH
jgi:two-component system chemotaxis sensor kinase CheA